VPNATVCLPTYNERGNLEPMLRALAPLGVRVLVIDDNSPDGTGELADRLVTELDHVDVLHRKRKEGLGPAYLAGFRHALANGAELVARGLDGLLHAIARVGDQLVRDLAHVVVAMMVPTLSPHTIRSMLSSSSMLNT